MKQTFEAWMKKVDARMTAVAGVSSEDISDFPYRDAFNDGESAGSTARDALRAAGFTGNIGFEA